MRRHRNELASLHGEIRSCTKCVAARYIDRAQPIVAGSASDPIAIVGQAPGTVELATNAPFSGRSGSTLRAWLAEAGLSEGELPYRTSITKCFPGKAASGDGDRRPSPAEIALCAPWLDRELAILRPRVVLLLGQLAIERFWGRAPLDEAVGRSRRDGDRLYIALPHPSGTSRWLNDPRNQDRLGRGLRILAREVRRLRSEGRLPRRRGDPRDGPARSREATVKPARDEAAIGLSARSAPSPAPRSARRQRSASRS